MKKFLITFLMAILFCPVVYSFDVSSNNKEKVDIEEIPNKDIKEDRSIKNVECYLNRYDNTLELEYFGIGIPVVYIFDENETIVSYQSMNGISNQTVINIPNIRGCYRIVIQSTVYNGEGGFYIY